MVPALPNVNLVNNVGFGFVLLTRMEVGLILK